MQLIQDDPKHYKLTGANQLQFAHASNDAEQRLTLIAELLDKLKIVEQKAA